MRGIAGSTILMSTVLLVFAMSGTSAAKQRDCGHISPVTQESPQDISAKGVSCKQAKKVLRGAIEAFDKKDEIVLQCKGEREKWGGWTFKVTFDKGPTLIKVTNARKTIFYVTGSSIDCRY